MYCRGAQHCNTLIVTSTLDTKKKKYRWKQSWNLYHFCCIAENNPFNCVQQNNHVVSFLQYTNWCTHFLHLQLQARGLAQGPEMLNTESTYFCFGLKPVAAVFFFFYRCLLRSGERPHRYQSLIKANYHPNSFQIATNHLYLMNPIKFILILNTT